jgi:flagellar protein FlgJ
MSTSTDPVDTAAFLQRIARPARRDYRRHQVPASVTMAQAILESGWGRSRLASVDRNYFGIKCRDGDPGPIATGCRTYETSEYDRKRKRYYKVKAQFRVYAKLGGSFRDHGAFLRDNSRYAAAFRYSTEPDRFAKAIAAAGYATSPTYADSLIRLMRKYDLYRYDA